MTLMAITSARVQNSNLQKMFVGCYQLARLARSKVTVLSYPNMNALQRSEKLLLFNLVHHPEYNNMRYQTLVNQVNCFSSIET